MDTKEFIFNKYKDEVVVSKTFRKEIKEKYSLSDKEISNLYVRINNYQVKTYGERLNTFEYTTPEENERANHNASVRRYKKRNYGSRINSKRIQKNDRGV